MDGREERKGKNDGGDALLFNHHRREATSRSGRPVRASGQVALTRPRDSRAHLRPPQVQHTRAHVVAVRALPQATTHPAACLFEQREE
jgi:hypothetical protein